MNHSLGPQRKGEREREYEGKKEQQQEEEEVVQRGAPLIFLAHPQKQEVGGGEPMGAGPCLQWRDGRRVQWRIRDPLCVPPG